MLAPAARHVTERGGWPPRAEKWAIIAGIHSERTRAFADSLAFNWRVVVGEELLRKAQDECDIENRWSGSLFRLWCALIFMGGPYDAMMRFSIRGRNGQKVLRVLSSVLNQAAAFVLVGHSQAPPPFLPPMTCRRCRTHAASVCAMLLTGLCFEVMHSGSRLFLTVLTLD